MKTRRWPEPRTVARAILAAAFFAAGVLHLLTPGPFLGITPAWVPWPAEVIRLTGVAELFGAVGLYSPRLRRAAGMGLALYAVCVFPANIKHAIDDLGAAQPVLGWVYHGPRLLFQPVIVWWSLWAGAVIDWPFRRRPASPA